jgi:hypothetical protein
MEHSLLIVGNKESIIDEVYGIVGVKNNSN